MKKTLGFEPFGFKLIVVATAFLFDDFPIKKSFAKHESSHDHRSKYRFHLD